MTTVNTPRMWNAEHALLRRLLEKDKDYAEIKWMRSKLKE